MLEIDGAGPLSRVSAGIYNKSSVRSVPAPDELSPEILASILEQESFTDREQLKLVGCFQWSFSSGFPLEFHGFLQVV